jgi:hypothetical protein
VPPFERGMVFSYPLARVWHVDFDNARVTGRQNHGAALVAELLVRALDHAVALASTGGTDFPGSGHFKALLARGFRFHLGHFAIVLSKQYEAAMACPLQARRLKSRC